MADLQSHGPPSPGPVPAPSPQPPWRLEVEGGHGIALEKLGAEVQARAQVVACKLHGILGALLVQPPSSLRKIGEMSIDFR